jgi:hypothetical protein
LIDNFWRYSRPKMEFVGFVMKRGSRRRLTPFYYFILLTNSKSLDFYYAWSLRVMDDNKYVILVLGLLLATTITSKYQQQKSNA